MLLLRLLWVLEALPGVRIPAFGIVRKGACVSARSWAVYRRYLTCVLSSFPSLLGLRSQGGGCGVGVGIGWGIFLFGVGTPVVTIRDMVGYEDRQLNRAYEQAMKEREEGIRPPIGAAPKHWGTDTDPLLDRLLRLIQKRRAQRTERIRFHIKER